MWKQWNLVCPWYTYVSVHVVLIRLCNTGGRPKQLMMTESSEWFIYPKTDGVRGGSGLRCACRWKAREIGEKNCGISVREFTLAADEFDELRYALVIRTDAERVAANAKTLTRLFGDLPTLKHTTPSTQTRQILHFITQIHFFLPTTTNYENRRRKVRT